MLCSQLLPWAQLNSASPIASANSTPTIAWWRARQAESGRERSGEQAHPRITDAVI